jgi:hypothetical protein
MQVTLAEAAQILGLSEKTVRRRVVSGRLQATQMSTYKGYTWIVELPDDMAKPESGELQALLSSSTYYCNRPRPPCLPRKVPHVPGGNSGDGVNHFSPLNSPIWHRL